MPFALSSGYTYSSSGLEGLKVGRPGENRVNVPSPSEDEKRRREPAATETYHGAQIAHHLSAIVESSDDAIVSKTLDGIVQSWNPGAERIFGFPAAEMIGQSIRRIIPHDLQAEEDEVLLRIRRGERVDHFETIRQRKDGSLVPISLTVSPVKNDAGEVVGASKIARDISAQKAAEEALRASMALKDQFMSLVSHELRTPVASVVGNAQLLLRRGEQMSASSRIESLTDITDEAERLQSIIEDLLVLTRLSAERDIGMAEFDLVEVVEDVARTARARHREYVLDVSSDVPLVTAAESLIRLVVQNLFSNADKYSPAGSAVQVVIRRSDQGGAEVQVMDRGPGIDADAVARIFEPFYRAASTREGRPGMGLGLAVCQKAIDAHGGWIGFEPRQGGGSTFLFRLPPT